MKVIILAGGFGTRLSEYTDVIPKPMVTVGGRPILWHIMNTYAKYGHKDFFLALGYKAQVVKDYFRNYYTLNSDFTVDLANGSVEMINQESKDWKVTLVDTGLNSMTGGRVKRMAQLIGNEPFLLTYGDGVADVNVSELVNFHKSHGKLVTVTAVRPSARFGELELNGTSVTSFKEKPQIKQGWINGGYFVIQPEVFDLIEGDDTDFEKATLEKIVTMGQLESFRHEGYWQCMDTKRDRDVLESLWDSGEAPWRV